MKYGIKTYAQVPNPEGIPSAWPAFTISYMDADAVIEQELISQGYTIMTAVAYADYIVAHQADYDAWAEVHLIDGLRNDIRDRIDDRTDELIADGFVYQDKHFKTDLEHQNSYMFDYLLCQTYPHTVKGVGEDYITFQDRNEHTLFIGTGFGTVDAMIRYGWELKNGLDGLTYQQLLAWTDPRG